MQLRFSSILYLVLICLFLIGCSPTTPGATPNGLPSVTSSPSPETANPTHTPSARAEDTPTPTGLPSKVILVSPQEADPALANLLETTLKDLAASQGFEFAVVPTLTPADLAPNLRLVAALPPDPGLVALANAAPATQFLAISIPDLEPGDNLSLIAPMGAPADQTGFLAGYLAALVTPEWRVGVIASNDTQQGISARQGFLNGVVFFCGLCRQTYPPYYTYPMYVELPAGASSAEWQAAADLLIDKAVQTVYISPEVGDEALLNHLAQAGLQLIGSVKPPENVQESWIATIQPDYASAIQAIWPDLINGQGSRRLSPAFGLTNVNPELLSPARERLIERLIEDLEGGFIDTGLSAPAGEN